MSGDQLNRQNSSASADWPFGNQSTMRMVQPNSSNPICQGIQMGSSSSCPPVSIVDTFCPNLWNLSTNPQNLDFSENSASTSGSIPIGKPIPLSPRMNMRFNSLDPTIPKAGVFLPSNLGNLPPSLSHFPADASFVERAARFSSFSGGTFDAMANPFGTSEPSRPYSNSSTSVVGLQTQKNELVMTEVLADVSMPIDHASKSESPKKIRRDNVGGREDTPDLANVSGDSSSKGICAKKRKMINQDMELDQAQGGPQFSAETSRENVEGKQKLEQNSSALGNGKPSGKMAKDTSDAAKEDYIHMRARRGQATNSHSLAERVRRERISERMKYLQDLVPGCSKVTGKAVMLDEIINYVQSLQRQVEFLSMKLSAVNPSMDVNIEGLLPKDLFQPLSGPSTMGFSTDLIHPQLLPHQQGLVQTGISGIVNHSDALRRAINAQLTALNGFKEPTVQMPNPWDAELHNVLQMSFATSPSSNTHELNGKPHNGFPI